MPATAGRQVTDDDLPPGLPAASSTDEDYLIVENLARVDDAELLDWVITLARSRAVATIKAYRTDFTKGKIKPSTLARNEVKWNAKIARLDEFKNLARI